MNLHRSKPLSGRECTTMGLPLLTGGHDAATKITPLGKRLSIRVLVGPAKSGVALAEGISISPQPNWTMERYFAIWSRIYNRTSMCKTAGPCSSNGRRASVANIINPGMRKRATPGGHAKGSPLASCKATLHVACGPESSRQRKFLSSPSSLRTATIYSITHCPIGFEATTSQKLSTRPMGSLASDDYACINQSH